MGQEGFQWMVGGSVGRCWWIIDDLIKLFLLAVYFPFRNVERNQFKVEAKISL